MFWNSTVQYGKYVPIGCALEKMLVSFENRMFAHICECGHIKCVHV